MECIDRKLSFVIVSSYVSLVSFLKTREKSHSKKIKYDKIIYKEKQGNENTILD